MEENLPSTVLVVGPHDRELRVNRYLQKFASQDFRLACSSNPRFSLLPDDEFSIVKNYFHFLANWALPDDSYVDIAYLYLFARKYDDRALAEQITDHFCVVANDQALLLGDSMLEVVGVIFDGTASNDVIRRLLVDAFVIFVSEAHYLDDFNPKFLQLLSKTRSRKRVAPPARIEAKWYKDLSLPADTKEARLRTKKSRWDVRPVEVESIAAEENENKVDTGVKFEEDTGDEMEVDEKSRLRYQPHLDGLWYLGKSPWSYN